MGDVISGPSIPGCFLTIKKRKRYVGVISLLLRYSISLTRFSFINLSTNIGEPQLPGSIFLALLKWTIGVECALLLEQQFRFQHQLLLWFDPEIALRINNFCNTVYNEITSRAISWGKVCLIVGAWLIVLSLAMLCTHRKRRLRRLTGA